jgi:hypothetical protein
MTLLPLVGDQSVNSLSQHILVASTTGADKGNQEVATSHYRKLVLYRGVGKLDETTDNVSQTLVYIPTQATVTWRV